MVREVENKVFHRKMPIGQCKKMIQMEKSSFYKHPSNKGFKWDSSMEGKTIAEKGVGTKDSQKI